MTWDPAQYLRHADARARPFHELLTRVSVNAPTRVVDLGCGAGNLTTTLRQRWPHADVVGVDSSAEMLTRAREVDPHVTWQHADARDWSPHGPVDVLVSNATLQWIPDHLDRLSTWWSWLAPGGTLAVQVPGNFASPSHTVIRDVRLSPRWRDRVGEGAEDHLRTFPADVYARRLFGLGAVDVDAWETTYVHVLHGPDAVLDWVLGTTLRPVVAALTDASERAEFLAEVGAGLRAAYPADGERTLFPFRRVFFVGRKG